jgi:asparagine synthase (glutamine-hydrolysing)
MLRALAPGHPRGSLRLAGGRVGLVASGHDGYTTLLAGRRVGDAEAALALHGFLTNRAEFTRESGDDRLGEAILERFLQRGAAETAKSLRGEFAFVFWDGRSGEFSAGVDRVRIQSLLAADLPSGLVVASRMAAILDSPVAFEPAIDAASVLDVVGGSVVPGSRTILRRVSKVAAGHVLHAGASGVSSSAYWDIDYRHPSSAPVETLRAETKQALGAAIDERLSADGGEGGIGAFLSGGIDSSTITGLLTRSAGVPIRTFTIGFAEEGYNELSFARVAAESFRARHTEYYVTPADTLAAMEVVARGFDEPFANASAVPTYYCAKIGLEHGARAMYAGDGGDEIFAGNERYATNQLFAKYDAVPRWLRPALRAGVSGLGAALPVPIARKAAKYVRRASLPPAERLVSYGFWHVVSPLEMVEPGFLAQAGHYRPSDESIRQHEQALADTDLDRQLYLDMKVTIADNDILKVTRMCEQAGAAVRFPFLDERVVDVATRVPAAVKMKGQRLRVFFKETYADLLPPATLAKEKHGFGLPISIWLRTDPALHARMRDLVLGERSLARGYFRREALEDLVRRHAADTTPFFGTILWNLMILELWQRRVLDARSARSAPAGS